MHFYILDPTGLSVQKFEELQVRLQGYITEFNLIGEFGRVSTLKNIPSLIETAAARGATTIVACGNDDTFNLIMALSRAYDFVFSFIPFEDNSFIAKVLGIENLFQAVKVLAARRIEKIDLVKVNNHHFISYLEFGVTLRKLAQAGFWDSLKYLSSPVSKLSVRIDDAYTLDVDCLGGTLVNTRAYQSKDKTIANPTDGLLDLLLLEKLNRFEILRYRSAILEGRLEEIPKTTIIKCRKVEFMSPKGFPLELSGQTIAKFPAKVEIWPKGQKVIVGKNRLF